MLHLDVDGDQGSGTHAQHSPPVPASGDLTSTLPHDRPCGAAGQLARCPHGRDALLLNSPAEAKAALLPAGEHSQESPEFSLLPPGLRETEAAPGTCPPLTKDKWPKLVWAGTR